MTIIIKAFIKKQNIAKSFDVIFLLSLAYFLTGQIFECFFSDIHLDYTVFSNSSAIRAGYACLQSIKK